MDLSKGTAFVLRGEAELQPRITVCTALILPSQKRFPLKARV